MSDISQISLGGVDYNIKDSNARSSIASLNNNVNTLNTRITNVSSDLTTEINKVDDKSDKLRTDFNGLQVSVSSISKNLNNKLDLNITETQVVQGTVEFNAIEAGSITEQGHAILTQDSIYNNLDSDSQVTVLSAGQGKVLNDTKAPKNHASATKNFGIGNVTDFGHVKLSDAIPAVNAAAPAATGGVAASQKALSIVAQRSSFHLIGNFTSSNEGTLVVDGYQFTLLDSISNYDLLIIEAEAGCMVTTPTSLSKKGSVRIPSETYMENTNTWVTAYQRLVYVDDINIIVHRPAAFTHLKIWGITSNLI